MGLTGAKLCGCDGECSCTVVSLDDHLGVTGPTAGVIGISFLGIAYSNADSCGIRFQGLGTDTDPLCAIACQRTVGCV